MKMLPVLNGMRAGLEELALEIFGLLLRRLGKQRRRPVLGQLGRGAVDDELAVGYEVLEAALLHLGGFL